MSPKAQKAPGPRPVATNRKARYDYDVLEQYECGIALEGSEVKSLREGRVQLRDSYARVQQGEVWLHGVHIAPYAYAHGRDGHDPDRPRKLLLHLEHVRQLPLEGARPDMVAVVGADQLSGHFQLAALLAHASLHHECDA